MNIESVVVGLVLGDGCLTKDGQLNIWHSKKQEDYVKYKASLVEKLIEKPVKIRYARQLHYTGNIYEFCGFNVRHSLFKEALPKLYQNRIKIYSISELAKLDPLGLALWYMDDGSCDMKYRTNGIVGSCQTHLALYTSIEQAAVVQTYFKDYLNIDVNIRSTGSKKQEQYKYSIYMNTKNSIEYCSLIEPHIIKSMQYKIRHVAAVLNREVAQVVGECSVCGGSTYTTSSICKICQNKKVNDKQSSKRKEQ